MQDYWTRQTDEPLFKEAEWAKPERKSLRGKLLIIGGSGTEFSKIQAAYAQAIDTEVGECKVVLPRTAGKLVSQHPDIELVPVTATGNISLEAEADLLGFVGWADVVLFPGELGRSNETTQVLEHIMDSIKTKLVITNDAIDLLNSFAKKVFERTSTTLVLSVSQLQNLVKEMSWPEAIKFSSTMPELVEKLHNLTEHFPCGLSIYFQSNLVTALNGEVITTKLEREPESWWLQTATLSACWWLWTSQQNSLNQSSWETKNKF